MGSNWPNFFIVGAQKAGTTSLYEYLKMHPQIFMSQMKEPHFFSQDRVRIDRDLVVTRESDYQRLFRTADGYKVIGEASPSYLWHSEVPARIYSSSPDARIVISLRDPVERAYSQYRMDVLDGCAESFDTLLLRESKSIQKVYGTGRLYVELGDYYEQVRRYMRVFGRERVLVLMFEDLVCRPMETLTGIAEFLEIDQEPVKQISFIGTVYMPHMTPRSALVPYLMRLRGIRMAWRRIVPAEIRNYIRYAFLVKNGSKPPISQKAVALLSSIYEPDLIRLEELLGRPLPELRRVW